MKRFEPNKNSKELEIDTTRDFVVVRAVGGLNKGDIVTVDRDDLSIIPKFARKTDGIRYYYPWVNLYYADEQGTLQEETKPKRETYTTVKVRDSDGLKFTEDKIGLDTVEEVQLQYDEAKSLLATHGNLFPKKK